MSKNQNLYFVAIIPPEPIVSEVKQQKQEVFRLFESRRALRSPAHITLFPPFNADAGLLRDVFTCLSAIGNQTTPFSLSLNGYGCFRPKVIFIKPEPSKDLIKLRNLVVDDLHSDNNDGPNVARRFHPHMTIAFRDLKKDVFPDAWDYFRNSVYKRRFDVSDVSLLQLHADGWRILKRFSFGDDTAAPL
jgi:2'-5' RNA ligase